MTKHSQLSIGQVESAARAMARKSDAGSLFVAAQLYAGAEKDDLAKAMGLLALKEASLKHEHGKIESFLQHLPGFDVSAILGILSITNAIFLLKTLK